jgi:uncharacterized protein (TIGR03663 family)
LTTDNTSAEQVQSLTGRWVGGLWTTGDAAESTSDERQIQRTLWDVSDSAGGLKIPFRIEWSIYAGLVLVALAMRLYDLGGRAVHHDESLHGYFAYQLFTGGGYDHNPLMHGMFQFYSIATAFFFVGDSDFSMRLPMAIFGTGLVLVPLLLKTRIGQVGALVAAVLLAFSPSMLYFSRFARNDIFMAVFALALVGVMWRYIDERKHRWLYIGAGLVALGFTTKETMYLVVALLMAFLGTQVWRELRDWLFARSTLSEFSPSASFLVLLGTLVLPLLAAAVAIFQNAFGLTLAAEDGLPGVPTGSPDGNGWPVAIGITSALVPTSLLFGWYWKRTVFLGAWAVFAAVFVLLFSGFGSNINGVGTGAWQSLGYWIAQQDVARGDQPWYYYFTIGAIYEFLPFLVAAAATAYYAFKSGFRPWLLLLFAAAGMAVLADASLSFERGIAGGSEEDVTTIMGKLALLVVYGSSIAIPLVLRTSTTNKFLIFWTIGTFISYTQAGEKMPWLLVNVSLPAIILAAKTLNDVVMSVDWSKAVRSKVAFTLAGVPLFYLLLWKVVSFDFSGGIWLFVGVWALLAGMGLLLLGLLILGNRIGRPQAFGVVGLVTAALLFGLTFRAGWVASYQNSDVPLEMLIYTQTSPDLHRLAKEIEQTAQLTGDRSKIKLAIDTRDAFSWPWQWYLRHYEQVAFTDHTSEEVEVGEDRLIAVINANNNDQVAPGIPDGFSNGRRLVHRWWFPEKYRDVTPGMFFGTLVDRDRWRGSIDYFLYRKLSNEIGSIDSFVYYSDELPLVPLE